MSLNLLGGENKANDLRLLLKTEILGVKNHT